VIVAGRESGKSHAAAHEAVRIMCERPDSESCLLMPTYKSTQPILKHIRRALKPLGANRWRWKAVDKIFVLWNGSKLYVRTEDKARDGVPTRGLTLDGVLWVDEAAFVSKSAFDAARFTQAAVADPKVIITTTPCGKNWVYDEWQTGRPGPNKSHLTESFRFKSVDSPYCNPEFIADMREKVGLKKALQELNAQFLGDAGSAFDPDDVTAMLVKNLKIRGKQLTLGLDLAKEVDYCVVTLMNEFGEAWILDRWKDMEWPDVETKVVGFAEEHDAIVVIDEGHGGGYGGAMKGYLERALGKDRVFAVKTGNFKVKAQICELLIGDMEARRLRVQEGEHTDSLDHEMRFFEKHREVVHGVELMKYHGPEGDKEDDHDDCVISLALANWGRLNAWDDDEDPLEGDFTGFGGTAGPTNLPTSGFGAPIDIGWRMAA